MSRRHQTTATLESVERPVLLRVRISAPPFHGSIYQLTLDDTEGRGFVSLVAPGWSASYSWPALGRGTASLLGFLLGCDVSYVSGKLGVGHDFDAEGTRRAIKVELWRGNRARYHEILRDCPPDFDDYQGWDRWLDRYVAAGYDRGRDVLPVWERFAACERIRPGFLDFYTSAWPLLRERRVEIEAQLYTNGCPAITRAA